MLLQKPLNPKKSAKIYCLYYANLKIYLHKQNFLKSRNSVSVKFQAAYTVVYKGFLSFREEPYNHNQISLVKNFFYVVAKKKVFTLNLSLISHISDLQGGALFHTPPQIHY